MGKPGRIEKRSKLDRGRYGVYFILPFFIAFLLLQIYPMLYTFYLSLTSWNGMAATKEMTGFSNYTRLFADTIFWKSMGNTVLIWFINVVPRMAAGLLIAVLLTQCRVKGAKFFRAIFYFPNLVNASSIALLLALILNWKNGMLNKALVATGILQEGINWLGDPTSTRVAVASTIWWMWFGHATILFMTGILSVPEELMESARIDGAGPWRRFWSITFPLLKPTFSYVFVTSLIGGLQNFDIPMIVTDGLGSPDKSILTSVMYMYNLTFKSSQYGYGSAVAYGLFMVVMVVSMLTFRLVNGNQHSRRAV